VFQTVYARCNEAADLHRTAFLETFDLHYSIPGSRGVWTLYEEVSLVICLPSSLNKQLITR